MTDKRDPNYVLGVQDTARARGDEPTIPRPGRPDAEQGRASAPIGEHPSGPLAGPFSPPVGQESTPWIGAEDDDEEATVQADLGDLRLVQSLGSLSSHLANASATDTLIDDGGAQGGAQGGGDYRPPYQPPTGLPGPAREAQGGPARQPASQPDGQPAGPTSPPARQPAGKSAMQTSTPSAARVYADGTATTVAREQIDKEQLKASQVIQIPYSSTEVMGTIGSYDILAELGRGAMGVVYKAYSLRLCRMCALKVMIAGQHASAVEIVRFQNEAMLAARLQHPNIVSVFDAGEIDGQYYFVMEYVEGHPLSALIAHGSHEALGAGLWAMVEVAQALQYAHDKGIVHRDIKPDNILIDPEGHPHITDFGIAKSVDAAASMTAAGAIIGTPAYMSPEQMNGEIAAIGPRSDVYSLGATLYHLCAGQPPFVGASPLALMAQALLDEPDSPRDVAQQKLGRNLALDLETICMQALEKNAGNRYQSARAMAEDLRAHLEDRPISARPISGAERLQKLIRRNRTAFVGATVVFMTLLIVGLSFGVVLAFNIEKTSDSLRAQDRRAAVDHAGTLKTSIKVNMLQGRADVVRELVTGLRGDQKLSRVEVVRTDRTYAYTDLSTRRAVERRLSKPDVLAKIRVEWPRLMAAVDELRRITFENIDNNEQTNPGLYDYERSAWNDLLKAGVTVTRMERVDGEPMLTVLEPIANGEECQACHGDVEDGAYGQNRIRAVLVVQRSQKDVEARIQANKKATAIVGASTAGAILILIWIFARIFGVRLRRRRFAANR